MDNEKILVHTCCAPCFSVVHNSLEKKFSSIFMFWFNPNIHPFTEYKNRFFSVEKYLESSPDLKMIKIHKYDIAEFVRNCAFREANRCIYCYETRLDFLGKIASKSGFTHITTSLLASPFQQHEIIRSVCESVEKRYKVKFYYEDFRKNWKIRENSIVELDLYRQQYCGCIYSEEERYSSDIKNLT
ncbi:epoxyqueuosine reductase QueH [bacterium]|nr:epoxyqueuosine reductase QueH [bacterium]